MSNKLEISIEDMPVIVTSRTGDNIARMLKERNISQYRLSQVLRISQSAVKKWVDGDSVPTSDNLFRLAFIFGVKVEDIVAVG